MGYTEPQVNCLTGTPYQRPDGTWTCLDNIGDTGGYPLGISSKRGLTEYVYVTQPAPVQTLPAISVTANSLVEWVKGHPYIVLGGLALLFYLFFMGGGKFQGKTRTDITRWGI